MPACKAFLGIFARIQIPILIRKTRIMTYKFAMVFKQWAILVVLLIPMDAIVEPINNIMIEHATQRHSVWHQISHAILTSCQLGH